MNNEDYSFAWSKEEYASLHWEGVKEFINTLDNENYWDDLSKMTQLVGYVEVYFNTSKNLKYDHEIR